VAGVKLRAATQGDFGFIRGLTTDPVNTPFIGDDDAVQLARYLGDPAVRVLIWGADAGFAIFREVGNASGRVELFRLALARTSVGGGAAFVAALLAYGFNDLGAARIWLDASSENLRAQKVYERAGFVLEGRLRRHWHRPSPGRSVDLLMYGILRDEWFMRAA
jgi:ribosomal protein S18 acetylase RimI-like enzyme